MKTKRYKRTKKEKPNILRELTVKGVNAYVLNTGDVIIEKDGHVKMIAGEEWGRGNADLSL